MGIPREECEVHDISPPMRSTIQTPALKINSTGMSMQFVELCWLILVLFWIVSAISVKPVKERPSRGQPAGHDLPPDIFLFLAAVNSFRPGWIRLLEQCKKSSTRDGLHVSNLTFQTLTATKD
jgi:hypothetical protein